MQNLNEQFDIIRRGTVEIIQEDELRKKLQSSLKNKKPLIVKAGFDPTVPDIHLGHTVLLRKLRHFQDCGHKVVFLIGDATALVGDPSGRSKTRKTLTWDEVQKNAKTYVEQISSILITNDAKLFELKRNRKWFDVPNFFDSFIELSQRYTIARLLERDDFQIRLKNNKPISFLELFYPLMQGYDSVILKADIEIGGTDQKFNMLVGRNLQQAYGMGPQTVITVPILEGLDGVNKMSKSLNNYIGINESAEQMVGKIMSVSDELMLKYYELLTDVSFENLKQDLKNEKLHPKSAKENLAKLVTEQYHDKRKVKEAILNFNKVFSHGKIPENIPACTVSADSISILDLVKKTNLVESSSQAKRLIEQGAVSVEGKPVKQPGHLIKVGKKPIVLKIGKRRFAKIIKK